MEEIQAMLSGEMEMNDFAAVLHADPKVQDALNRLIPEDAKNNKKHAIWEKCSFQAMVRYGFNLYAYLCGRFKFDNSLGDNLNIFGWVSRVYRYRDPYFVFTTKYDDAFGLYLHAIQDCFDGPEVRGLVYSIVEAALKIQGAGKRKAYAKSKILRQFHVTDKRHPHWIQGPEWPMGAHSPMKFTGQERRGETVYYYFADTDTGEERIVEQFY